MNKKEVREPLYKPKVQQLLLKWIPEFASAKQKSHLRLLQKSKALSVQMERSGIEDSSK